ncbi:MAG: ABC transporter permease [Planctomycetaceae bacterium]
MSDAWTIALKDLRLQFRDRRALTTLLALPIVFIAIIGLTTGQLLNTADKQRKYRIAVVDEDQSLLSGKVIDLLRHKKGLQVELHAADKAEALLSDERTDAVLFIGQRFQELVRELQPYDLTDTEHGKLFSGQKGDTTASLATLDIVLRSQASFESAVANMENQMFAATVQVITPYVMCGNALARRWVMQGRCVDYQFPDPDASLEPTADPISRPMSEEDAETEPSAATASSPADATLGEQPDEGEEDEEFSATPAAATTKRAGRNPYQFLVPGFTVMFVFFLVNIMARSFLHERDLGTLRRLRLAPIRPTSLLLGKTIPFFIISLAQTALLFLFGRILFDMSWGPQPWLLIPVIVATSLAATGLGLLIATLVRSDAQVSAYANLVVIGLAGISGCFMPREWLPELMREASLASPHAWALIAYNQLLARDTPNTATVYEACGWLLVFTAVFFALGAWRFRRVE